MAVALPRSWYNELESESVLGDHADLVMANGWTVVNGRKALQGSITWKGEPRNGAHYAAGPLPDHEAAWLIAKATVLEPIGNATILDQVVAFIQHRKLRKHGERMEDAIARLGGIQQLAAGMGLPWLDPATIELEVMALIDHLGQLIQERSEQVVIAARKGTAQELVVSCDLHAISERALRQAVAHFADLGWKVDVDAPGASKRVWRMTRGAE